MSGSKALELIGEDLQLLVVHVPHARAIGLTVVDARPGEIWLRVPYADFLVGNPEIVQALAKLKSYLDYGTFQPIQIAAARQ